MSDSRRVRRRRVAACGMVQADYRTPRTTDSVVMPALATASLAAKAVQTGVNLLVHLIDVSGGKSTTGKPGGGKGKSTDGKDLTNAFAACLATAAGAAGAAAPVPVVVGKETPVVAATGAKSPSMSLPGTLSPTLTKLPQGPSVAAAKVATVAAHTAAMQSSVAAAQKAAHGPTEAAVTPTVPAPAVGSAKPAAPPASVIESVQPGVTDTPSPLLQVHAPDLSAAVEAPAAAKIETAAIAHVSETAATTANDIPLSLAFGSPHESGPQATPTPATPVAQAATIAAPAAPSHAARTDVHQNANAPAPTPTDAPPPSGPAPSGPTVAATPNGNAPTTPTVAEQLTQAFVAQANVAGHDGRTDFHLRLDPPQLGTVQIHLTATDHNISARVVVASEGTRQLLEGQAHHLRQSLADAGFALTGFDVSRGGGGPSGGGGGYQPPEPPLPLVASIPTPPRPAAVNIIPTTAPTNGINVLA